MRRAALILIAALAGSSVLVAQTTTKPPAATTKKPARGPPTRKPSTATPLPPVTAPAKLSCPMVFGYGARDGVSFCDVLIGREPAGGIVIEFPRHQGPATSS